MSQPLVFQVINFGKLSNYIPEISVPSSLCFPAIITLLSAFPPCLFHLPAPLLLISEISFHKNYLYPSLYLSACFPGKPSYDIDLMLPDIPVFKENLEIWIFMRNS